MPFQYRVFVLGILCFTGHLFSADRVTSGLLSLYDFESTEGDTVLDRSQVGEPINLRIADSNRVTRAKGSLQIHGKTIIRSEQPGSKITSAVLASGEITIEAWIHPANTKQEGPARIVTLSADANERNFTLGQEKDRIEARFRATRTSKNGTPGLTTGSKSVGAKLSHIVFTRSSQGKGQVFINGEKHGDRAFAGEAKNWANNYRLALANELTNDRPWLGTIYLVAVYGRALESDEIVQNFKAGVKGKSPAPSLPIATARKPTPPPTGTVGTTSRHGLVAFYDFQSPDGDIVFDRSGSGKPINLKIKNPNAVKRSPGQLHVHGETLIQSDSRASRLTEAIRKTGAITIEAWVEPANTKQEGPARIVTLSQNSISRNFTLGQEGDEYETRFRTSQSSKNGQPTLNSKAKTVETKRTHLVFSRNRRGNAKFYINGRLASSKSLPGTTANWEDDHRLALADEFTGGRPWRGTYHQVALYSRDLSMAEVIGNFQAGPGAGPATIAESRIDPKAVYFEDTIAPLLANHCLECHDSSSQEGDLDLSRKDAAFANHKAIDLWHSVDLDEMPHRRDPLSANEKKQLHDWVKAGATWSLAEIDAANYLHKPSSDVWVQRLTIPEYIETVRATTGVDISAEARYLLPPDMRADGFSNTAYNLNIDLKHVEIYARLASLITSRIDIQPYAEQFWARQDLTDKNMRALIETMGKWLFRGPLERSETDLYRGISTTVASTGGTYEEAVGFILEAMLQSPRFIYRIENQQSYGPRPVDAFELATRMSYITWGGPPDKELYNAAESGKLYQPAETLAQIERMMKDPRAMSRSLQFAEEWLNLGRMANLQPSRKRFPTWDASLAEDMRQESLAVFEQVLWKERKPMTELLRAQFTIASPKLAKHYGLPPQAKTARYDLSAVPGRGGILTHGSVLTIGGDEASMVSRGLFVLHDLLRGVVKDPPACVDTTPVPTEAGLTQRGIAEARIRDKNCGGCHEKFEPLAFGLEKFDGIGAYHDADEHGNQLREDGSILIPGEAAPRAYKTTTQLMNLLAESDRVGHSLTSKLTQFALGRPLSPRDMKEVAKIHLNGTKAGGTYQDILTAILLSDLVKMTPGTGS